MTSSLKDPSVSIIVPRLPPLRRGGFARTLATGAAVAFERRLADVLASVVEKDGVPTDANFCQDLGATRW